VRREGGGGVRVGDSVWVGERGGEPITLLKRGTVGLGGVGRNWAEKNRGSWYTGCGESVGEGVG